MTAKQTEEERLQMFRRYHEMSLEELEAIHNDPWRRMVNTLVLCVAIAIIICVMLVFIGGMT